MKPLKIVLGVALALGLSAHASGESLPTYDWQTGVIDIPVIVGEQARFSVRMQVDGAGALEVTAAELYKPGLTAHEGVAGFYQGLKKTPDTCADAVFPVSLAEIFIELDGDLVFIEQRSYFDAECQFSGSQGPTGVSGTYECSNFDAGTWRAVDLRTTSEGSFYALLHVDVPGRDCDYEVEYIGFQ